MNLRHISLALLSFTLIPSAAFADPAGPEGLEVACRGMVVTPFDAAFPANASPVLQVSVSGGGSFDEFETPEVFREQDGSFVLAPFRLTDADNPYSSRLLELTTPQPGPHIVTWGGGDCGGSASPVDPTKVIIGQFEVLADADLPTRLGEFISVEGTPSGGPRPSWIATFDVDLFDEMEPWQDIAVYGIDIDGVLVRPYAPGNAVDGRLSEEYIYWCDGTLEPGLHEATIVAQVEDVDVRTEAVEMEITCPEPTKTGCSVGALDSGTWFGVLLMLGLVGFRRRRTE